MKRTKKMMLVTLMATTAIAMMLMSKAFAAPAADNITGTTKTCPTKTELTALMNSKGINLPAAKGMTAADLQKLLAQYGIKTPAASNCPKTKPAPAPTTKPAPMPAPTAKPTTPPAPAPTATPAPTAPAGSMTAEEQKMINLVNQERTKAGLKALVFDSTLRVPALKHSQDMSKNNFFSHTSPTYGTFSTRLKASGVKYSTAGENLAMYGSVEKAHVGLMNSEGHRANIMNTNYTRIGIGIVFNQSKGTYYITQWFAK